MPLGEEQDQGNMTGQPQLHLYSVTTLVKNDCWQKVSRLKQNLNSRDFLPLVILLPKDPIIWLMERDAYTFTRSGVFVQKLSPLLLQ